MLLAPPRAASSSRSRSLSSPGGLVGWEGGRGWCSSPIINPAGKPPPHSYCCLLLFILVLLLTASPLKATAEFCCQFCFCVMVILSFFSSYQNKHWTAKAFSTVADPTPDAFVSLFQLQHVFQIITELARL